MPTNISYFHRPQTKLREGDVFTPVCDSVHRGSMHDRGAWHAWQGSMYGGGRGFHARETATEAGGIHPTGMHSCISFKISHFQLKPSGTFEISIPGNPKLSW